jgi:transposase
MQEKRNDSELRLMVTGVRRDGRRRYDRQSKLALAKACLQPGVSLAGMALKHGVNANLLRKWVVSYQMAKAGSASSMTMDDPVGAFVPVMLSGAGAPPMEKHTQSAIPPAAAIPQQAWLRAQLPNGVTFEFDCAGQDMTLVSVIIETLGRCDVPSRR